MMVLNILLVIKKVKLLDRLCIILPQMNGYIKYFENGGKYMSFVFKGNDALDKYNEIRKKIKNTLNAKFHSIPVFDEKYAKAKVREFGGVIKANFLGDEIPKENVHYTCIACVIIDSVVRMEKKNYLQVYLEEHKYKMKKIEMPKIIKPESESASEPKLESDTESESNSELESDTE